MLRIPLTGIKKNQRVPLVTKEGIPVQTVAQGCAGLLNRLQTQRSDNTLPTLARTPKLNEYSARYLDFIGSGQGTKKLGTVAKEKALLKRWGDYIGGVASRPDQAGSRQSVYRISPEAKTCRREPLT